jgi:hypothetical protein
MPRGVAHPPEVRARAHSLLLAGHSQAEVIEETGLGKAVVCRLAAELGDQLERVGTKTVETDAELIMAYFRAALRAMRSQVEVLGDPDYCRTQRADALAIAHGVIGDKLAGIATTAQTLGLFAEGHAALPAGEDMGTSSGAVGDYEDGAPVQRPGVWATVRED